MNKIRVGIIGFGLSGKSFHYQLLRFHPGYEITMISTTRISEVNELDPKITVTQNAQDIIKAPSIDLIINTAPNIYHFNYTKEALLNGKHVVVEKPFVTNSNEGKLLISIAEQSGKYLSVYHNRRWDGDFLTLQKLLSEQKLGAIKYFESHFDRWNPNIKVDKWREQPNPGSGILFDLGSHLIDQALVLFGLPLSIFADIGSQKKGSLVDDYFHLILNYNDEKRVILHSSSFTQSTPRFQVFGDKAGFVKFGLDPQEKQLKDNQSYLDPHFGVEPQDYHCQLFSAESLLTQNFPTDRGSYICYYNQLHHKITTHKGEVPVKATDALQVIKLIELALESSKCGKVMALSDTF